MGNISVIVPEATTNEITNPSFELNTTGWTNNGMLTFSRSNTQVRKGFSSLNLESDAVADYVVSNTVANADGGETWTASCWVYITSGDFKLTIQENNAGWSDKGSATSSTTGQWVEVTVTVTLSAGVTDARVKLGPNATAASQFWVDAVQFEQKAYSTTYCDGEQPGCVWAGTPHASTSSRTAQIRSGGRVRDIHDIYSLLMMEMSGFGMPPINHNSRPYALLPGAQMQRVKVKERPFIITFDHLAGALSTYHARRDSLIDVLKHDLVSPLQPTVLRYTGNTSPVEIAAYYDAGLEGLLRGSEGIQERLAVRFIAYDPFWYEVGDANYYFAGFAPSVANADYAIKKVAGTWSNFTTFNGQVQSMVLGPNKKLYLGGAFTNAGDANGDYIVSWDPSAGIASLGTGLNANCLAMVFDAAGNLYLGGAFTIAGGVANTAYIAKWDGSAFTALSTGLGNECDALAISQTGLVYVGGNFTNQGDASGDYIVSWSGAAWASLGTGLNGRCWALRIAPNGSLYVGGVFTTAGGTTVNGIAKWSGTAWSALGSGVSGGSATVYAIAVDVAGNVYIGGSFTSVGGVAASNIAKWNGTNWAALGSGCNNTVFSLNFDDDGLLHIGGAMTSAGGLTLAEGYAIWNGSTYVHPDVDLPGTATLNIMLPNGDDRYIGYSTSGTAAASQTSTVTNNGTAEAFPKIQLIVTGAGRTLKWIKNETTGKTMWFNYALLTGETLTIDLAQGKKSIVSSYFGNVLGRALLPGSDFATWSLLPGSNVLTTFTPSGGGMEMVLVWRNAHHSVDGAV